MRAVFVSHFEPRPEGHGGEHRAYQIHRNLSDAFGKESVSVCIWDGSARSSTSSQGPAHESTTRAWVTSRWRALELDQRWQGFRHLPREGMVLQQLSRQARVVKAYASDSFRNRYRAVIETARPAIAVFEHVGFSELIALNAAEGIDSVACTQNFESLNAAVPLQSGAPVPLAKMGVEMGAELSVLAACSRRFFISKTELALVRGLGVDSSYYPYVPVGEVRRRLWEIRQRRRVTQRESGLFLLLGTAYHASTRHSMEWLINAAADYRLPEQVRIVVAGNGTEELDQRGIPGIKFMGCVSDAVLGDLLTTAAGVLIPQRMGFGALTRVPELSCAGVPGLVSSHAFGMMDCPPGFKVIGDTWAEWRDAIMAMAGEPEGGPSEEQYAHWEDGLDRSFANYLAKRAG